MKRIATERQWNPNLYGGRQDPELAAMRSLVMQERFARMPETEASEPRLVKEADADCDEEAPF
jgi:hypothetical protein